MANPYKLYSIAQFIVTDGDINTSNIIISGSLRIDWNKYLRKKSLLDCLDFGGSDTQCNCPDVSLINLGGELGN
jgi:hypothetical protein